MSIPSVSAPGRRIGLALGGGGARGYAHIGVIEVLTQQGFDVVAVAGSSMGALVGGLFAAGQLEPYTAWVRSIGQREVLRLLDPTLRGPGAIGAEKVMARVGELIGDMRLEDLPIPMTAVATDLLSRRSVWFQRGLLRHAVRASIALPPAITPVMIQGRLLSDGGLTDPVPIAPIASAPADLIVAVSLNGLRGNGLAAPVREQAVDRPLVGLARKRKSTARGPDGAPGAPAAILDSADALSARGERVFPDLDALLEDLPPGLRKIDAVNLSMEAVSAQLTRYRLAGLPPDLLIEVPVDACGTLEFHRAEEMIALGRKCAREALAHSGLGT